MPERPYDHTEIEVKWQERWKSGELYYADADSSKPKYYVVEMLPYPSGRLHMGHVRNYAIGDALARYMWMRGYNVTHPPKTPRSRAAHIPANGPPPASPK